MGPLYEVRQDRPGEAFVYARADCMGVASYKPASAQGEEEMTPTQKLFAPMPDDVFNRTPPRLRVMYMVKRILNQARKQAAYEAARKAVAELPK